MCGIIGSINLQFDTNTVDRLMGHRGPDERNSYKTDNIQLYHLRLAILAIDSGQQPMHYLDRYTIIFNGEIYNHEALRRKHKLDCKTSSDTETLLHIYHKLGASCLDDIDGMFALAIYDNQTQQIFLARDRAGKKPLYIYNNKDKLVFASELNTLNALLPLEVDESNIANYLRLGSMYRAQTPYKNITELAGGHFALINTESLKMEIKQWWNISDFYRKKNTDSFETALKNVDNYLIQAVKRRVDSSDLEVGAFLSGGIDSGLVTAIASQYSSNLRTFTVSFGGEYDEAPLAKLVAEKYNTNHTEIKISFDNLINNVEKIICNYGEPYLSDSAIPSYYVSKAAKEYITVVLNGDGADELFAGYRRYVPYNYHDFFKTSAPTRAVFDLIHRVLPQTHNKKSKYNYLYRLADLGGKKSIDTYLSSITNIFEGYTEHLLSQNVGKTILSDFNKVNSYKISGLKKIMNLDFNTILFSDLLVKMDIATMANSLEGRSPFLSKELLEYAPQISDKYKIRGTTTKFLLRELSRKYLPKPLIGQPKRGFEIPLKKWVEDDLKEFVFDYLNSPKIVNEYVDKKFLQNLLNFKVQISKEKRAKILWTLTCLEVWYKNYKNIISN